MTREDAKQQIQKIAIIFSPNDRENAELPIKREKVYEIKSLKLLFGLLIIQKTASTYSVILYMYSVSRTLIFIFEFQKYTS